MAVDVISAAPSGDVKANLNFTKHPAPGVVLFNYVEEPPEGQPQRNAEVETREVLIRDIRGHESERTLDEDAFQVIRGVPPSKEVEFEDDASIQKNYYPEVEQLLLSHIPGSRKIIFFDHTVRRTRPGAKRAPVQRVHIDQTPESVIQRVRRHASQEEADALLAGRYRIVNVWRPLNKNPVESFPLAFASSASLDDADILPVEHRYPDGYTGQTAAIKYSPSQRWYYLSGMTGDERLLLECFDSEGLRDGTGVRGGRAAHTAFEDPRSRPDAEGRESIEVRALVFGP